MKHPPVQAEVFWLREQLDRERSRANTAPSETRRLALETAQKQREVIALQGQVATLRQHLQNTEAALQAQEIDLAVCKRAQLQDDWTRYAATRKRLLTSMVNVCPAYLQILSRTFKYLGLPRSSWLHACIHSIPTGLQRTSAP